MKTGDSDSSVIRIGELSRRTGVSPDMLRFYEAKGLLPRVLRTVSGYRQYPSPIVKRVRTIRVALAIGFSLGELAEIFKARDSGGAPCRSVRALAEKKLEGIEERLLELTRHRELLASVLLDWDKRLANGAPGTRVGLLEALMDMESVPVRSNSRRLEERFGNRKKGKR